ncbi:MAG: UDP-N-acetylmuramate dehydrogenase [Cephaloticoccus sp.]|nr:UDP-N-acetylmuramate dehydrogenase [Cephaloticoccus sp.]
MNARAPVEFFGQPVTAIHGVGVGGMGLAPLAIYLAGLGCRVTGEDDALSDEMGTQLRHAGVRVTALPEDCDLVVLSSAIHDEHPTVGLARDRKIKLVRRGEMLAEVARDRKLVAVCGSHGKTTTTAMLVTVLQQAGFEAGYILGGLFASGNLAPARVGSNEWLVAEVDESDGTITHFAPEITLAVNLDWDHVDHYKKSEEILATFADLFARTRGSVLCHASASLGSNSPRGDNPPKSTAIHTFGNEGDFVGRSKETGSAGMTLWLGGRFACETVRVKAWGEFNAANATGALAAAQLMGVKFGEAALADFSGVRRRQAVLAEFDGVTVLEDYAHHPTEIKALLSAMRGRMTVGERLLVVFQPHRFSRTAQFLADFASALAVADRVLLLNVYGAGEKESAGGTTADLLLACQKLDLGPKVGHCSDDATLGQSLDQEVRPGDWVAFVGAGNIEHKARAWLARQRREVWDKFFELIKPQLSAETKLSREEALAGKTTMRVGGAARLYAEPANLVDLQLLVRTAHRQHMPVYPLGRGSNLIVADAGVDGLVVALAHPQWATFEPRAEGRVWVGAGLRLKNLCGLAAKAGLVGFEFLEGIPGNVGGALRMNAGAMGGWMFDVVEEVQLLTLTGEIVTRKKSEMQVEYRHCADLDHAIALGALLRPAAAADMDSVNRQIDVYRRKRQESQPREPSAGCIFKNPPGNSAGRLIDEAGLKGERVGDAEVSTTHANFIVNRGHATGAEVLALIQRVRERVHQTNGVMLEPEAQLFGRDWKDIL